MSTVRVELQNIEETIINNLDSFERHFEGVIWSSDPDIFFDKQGLLIIQDYFAYDHDHISWNDYYTWENAINETK